MMMRRDRLSTLARAVLPARPPSPLAWLVLLASLGALSCATVRPEQRAVLADPSMRFEGEPGEKAALEHGLENREASYGGGSVRGGGCGCN